jgi:outer membrane protein assembly factor BamB
LVRAELTPSGYRELDRAHLIDPTSPLFEDKFAWSAPSMANRNLFVRNDQELRCYSMAGRSRPARRESKR